MSATAPVLVPGPAPGPAASMVHFDQVEKVYRTDRIETVALSNISLDVAQGEFISIMGPSGCGKSTLLHLMGLLDAPTRGRISLGGAAVTACGDRELSAMRNREIGFVFQTFHLVPDLTVLDNVELPLLYRRMSSGDRRRAALEALDRVGLAARVRHFPSQLSGGQQQRVAIARAIVGNPTILLADEPTGALDTRTSHDVMEIFRKLNEERGITIAFVTHEHDVAAYTRRIVSLRDGEIVADEPNVPVYAGQPLPPVAHPAHGAAGHAPPGSFETQA